MLTRILSALRARKAEQAAAAAPEPAGARASQPADRETIAGFDVYGREIKVERGEWRDKVLLPNVEQNWNEPGALYGLIVSGLENGFAAELMPAAARLVEIDDYHERCHVMHGIVLLKNGQLDAAEATLRTGIAKAGATGILLTNLAKVFAERGDEAAAEATLWRALEADPNQENGLLWCLSIQRERGGDAACLQTLHTIAAMPGSWRARLWLARHHLEKQEVEAARALYADVLAAGAFDGNALTMVSGDLGKHGQLALMLELAGPAYDEHKHDFMAGINLLRACWELGRADEGEALLGRMYALDLAPIRHQLDQFAQAFQEQRAASAHATPVDPYSLEIETLALGGPIWHYGLNGADWLFTQKLEGAQELGFFALSKIVDGAERAESQREDDVGRLSRAIPMYLAEAAHYWSDYATTFYVQVVEGGGPVVSGCEADGNALFDIVPAEMKYFVTGTIGCTGAGEELESQLSLTLWDCTTRTGHAIGSGKAGRAGLGELVLSLEQTLLLRAGLQRTRPLDAFYVRPTADVMPEYLDELGQALILTLVGSAHTPKSALWGERTMLDWPLTMALRWPTVEVPRLMYLSGLGKAFAYGSDVLSEYKERSLALLREAEQAGSPAARLAPLIWKIFGMQEALQAHIQRLPADTVPGYRAWLGRVSEQPDQRG